MKKNLLYLFTVLCTLSFFTACSDDDDDVKVLEGVNASFNGETLDLKYSGSPLLGKEVAFDTKDGQTATITMQGTLDLSAISGLFGGGSKANLPAISYAPGVIPGEVTTTLSNVVLTQVGETYTFEGTDEANGRTVKYTGEVKKDKMTLALDVTMPTNDLVGSWNVAPIIESDDWGGAYKSQPINVTWEAEPELEVFPGWSMPMNTIVNLALVMPVKGELNAHKLLQRVFESVDFRADGNVVASYSDGDNIAAPQWQTSPLNIAHYCVKGGKIFLYLNPDMIIKNITSKATKAGMENLPIAEMLTELLPMLSEGIPVAYTLNEGKLYTYADTELMLKLLNLLTPMLENEEFIKEIVDAVKSTPDMESFAPMLESMLKQLPGIVAGTTKLEAGINFIKE